MPNPTLGHYRDRAKEKQSQLELFETFQQLDIFALSRLLVAANLPKFSKWLKQATVCTLAESIPYDTPNYYKALAEKASQVLDQKIPVSTAKTILHRHGVSFVDTKETSS